MLLVTWLAEAVLGWRGGQKGTRQVAMKLLVLHFASGSRFA